MSQIGKIIGSLALLFTIAAAPVYAQVSSNSGMMERPIAPGRNVMMPIKTASSSANPKRENFKQKLMQITDTRKQAIVTKIDSDINTYNTTQTTQMSQNLTLLQDILGRISSEGATLKTQGKNTTALDAAVSSAQTTITNAQTAVTTQSQKDYTLNITSESALRSSVGMTISQFRIDMKTTRQSVLAARLAVLKAATELKKIVLPQVSTVPGASNSGMLMTH